MATQGIVTVRSEGQVVMKVVAGCNGMMAPKYAKLMKEQWPLSVADAHALALDVRFGSEDCLVVMSHTMEYFLGDENPSPLYRQTFDNPSFNPRWEIGIADYVEVIDV